MEPASQKETSPLDRFAINSLPHKSSAFVPQCETMDLAYIKMIWNHVAYSALRDYVSTHCRLQGASLVTKVTTSRALLGSYQHVKLLFIPPRGNHKIISIIWKVDI